MRLTPRFPIRSEPLRPQLFERRREVPDLEPERYIGARAGCSLADDLQRAVPEEEHRAARELLVDRQAKGVPVEGRGDFEIPGVHQHPAAQHLHGASLANRLHAAATATIPANRGHCEIDAV